MAEFIDTIANILCPTPDSFSTCQQFINEFAAQGPIQQMLYFIFFPTVFLILFVIILTKALPPVKEHDKLRLLLAVAIYIFVVINGWYAVTLALSRVWFVVIIIFAGAWYFIDRHFPEEGETKKGLSGIAKSAFRTLAGDVEINPIKLLENKKLLEDEIQKIERQKKELEDYYKTLHGGEEKKEVAQRIADLKKRLAELKHLKERGILPKE